MMINHGRSSLNKRPCQESGLEKGIFKWNNVIVLTVPSTGKGQFSTGALSSVNFEAIGGSLAGLV